MNRALQVRPGRPEDAGEIGRVHVASWCRAYVDIVSAANLAALDPAERAGIWKRAIEQGEGALPGTTLVATLGKHPDAPIVGFAFHGPSREEGPETGELVAIYAHPDHFGTGAGRALFERCVAEQREAGRERMILWVLAANARARGFYEAMGMVADGTVRPYQPRGPEAQELELARFLLEL
ncbi:MAG: GNAT family N-acetyltransferase [Planctomycetota bacterium]|nr:GNAT family N-acetyltransferase [Planctomycetota bacterium]